jgi:hypothetical protein
MAHYQCGNTDESYFIHVESRSTLLWTLKSALNVCQLFKLAKLGLQ